MVSYEDLPDRDHKRPRRGKRKAMVEWVVRSNFFEGFVDGVSGASKTGLEYASTSGIYDYNGVRRIAYDAGYEYGQERVEERQARLSGRQLPIAGGEYKIPAEVMALAYAETRLASE